MSDKIAATPLLIVGVSARAAAYSAIRAGLRPMAVDAFGDTDLVAVAPCVRPESWSSDDAIVEAARRLEPGPWMYAGALENRPGLVERIAQERPLWGNGAEVLACVRTPEVLAVRLGEAGVPYPEVRNAAVGLETDGRWLRKPRASAGGSRIEVWRGGTEDGRFYYQRRHRGRSFSAIGVAWPDGTEWFGVTLQEHGWRNRPFLYRGNLGPVEPGRRCRAVLERLGRLLAADFGLRGVFGVDFVMHRGRSWIVEINPRYTASVEVLEAAIGNAILKSHAAVFERNGDSRGLHRCLGTVSRTSYAGKRVVYANTALHVPLESDCLRRIAPGLAVRGADLPGPGSKIPEGAPVMTLLARGRRISDCNRLLDRAERHLRISCGPLERENRSVRANGGSTSFV